MKRIIKSAIAMLLVLTLSITVFTGCKKSSDDNSSDTSDYISDIVVSDDNTDSNVSSEEESEIEITASNTSSEEKNTSSTGNNTSSTGNNTSSIGNNTSSASTPSFNDPNAGGTKLTTEQEKKFASIKGSTVKVMVLGQKVTDEEKSFTNFFKEKYGCKVERVVLTWNEFVEKAPSLVAARTAPDFCITQSTTGLRYAFSGISQPLDSMLVKSDPVWQYNGKFGDHYIFNGKTHAVQNTSDNKYGAFWVYYNKTLFKEKKIKDPYTDYYLKNNWNFETFREVAKAATIKQGNNVQTYGVSCWSPMVFLMANGVKGITVDSNNKWSIDMNSKAAINGLQLVRDISADGSYGASGGYTEFYSRKTAMIIERPGNAIGNYDYYNRMRDEIGMVPMPKGPDVSKYHVPMGVQGYFVPTGAKNPLGGLAWAYEQIKYTKERYKTDTKMINKNMSAEHRAIADAHLKNAVLVDSHLDGLVDWYDGANNRESFWQPIRNQYKQPTQVIDSLYGLIKTSLEKTVGKNNIK